MDAHRSEERIGLYPTLEPYRTGVLDVGDGHSIYYEECGRADGVPVVAIHGGPGGGAAPAMRRFFDPKRYRIIVYDQRGCGRSRPFASVDHNDTDRLRGDLERLRTALGVERWLVFGGSWGATLALEYARKHREHVMAMVLRGVFACTRAELDWFYVRGANMMFPDAWARLVEPLSASERDDVLRAYHARVMVNDPERRRRDVINWARWESSLISMSAAGASGAPDPRRSDALSRIETHYFVNAGFLERDGVLLEDTGHLSDLPGVIVQGRYDMVTPARTAWTLKKSWDRADLEIVPDAGHAAGEPGVIDALVRATDRFAAALT